MAQVTGFCKVKIDGDLLRSKDGAKLDLGGKERTAQVGHSVYGFSEKTMPATLTFTLAHVAGDDLIGIGRKVDSTIEFETDTGDTYMMRNAFCSKPPEMTSGDGDVAFEFKGPPAEKV